MIQRKNISVFLCFCLLFVACKKTGNNVAGDSAGDANAGSDTVAYATGFQIEKHPDYTLVTVRNPWNTQTILQRYILVPKTVALPETLPEGIVIRTPLERTVSYGSVQCSFFAEFGALPSLVGVCEPHYINILYVQEGVQSGRIANVGLAANPNLEKIMMVAPEALFTAPIDGSGYGQTAKLGIPFIECLDYMESSPLGRAEWIRFMALFFEKEALADSLFHETVVNYNRLKELSERIGQHPTVFTERIYSGTWYLPGGKSYMSHFFHDSGANYLWKDDTSTGSIALSFESVLDKAEKAEFWLIKYNSPQGLTYDELVRNYPNYAFFDAFKNRNIYVCNTGKTTYYEDLPIHPDYVLEDMVRIFHPELFPNHQMRYFYKLTSDR